MKKYNPPYIDEEEKKTMEEIEKMDVKKIKKPTRGEKDMLRKAAQKYIRAEAKMNIRIGEEELKKIKERAGREGLKYQSFVKSILYKYMTGQLVEKK
jgi:predicted DNA binding CopG/RHH family protein